MLLDRSLKAVVIAVTFSGRVASRSKVDKGDVSYRLGGAAVCSYRASACRQDLRHGIGTRKHLAVSCRITHVPHRHRQGRVDFVLETQIVAHGVGRFIVVLDAATSQTFGSAQGRWKGRDSDDD